MQLSDALTDTQRRINALLEDKIASLGDHADRLKRAMGYSLLLGGKRMRPFLTYATGNMLGASQSDLDVPAMAVECIHAYSLIHDDLPAMDDDALRRGQPTCHIAFDDATAILAGDALQTLAFDILANSPLSTSADPARISLVRLLANAAGYQGMCGGQAMDLAATGKQISRQALQQLHEKKTGALLKVSVRMAVALAPDVPPEATRYLDQFADCVGLAFQVQDDILDVVGDSKTLGKPQGSDEAANKSTYPALMGLDHAKEYLQTLHQDALQALRALPYNTEVLQAFTDYNLQRDH